jgi:hypothetical protein
MNDRYRVLSDDSGHEYFVQIKDEDVFYRWVAAEGGYAEDGYEGPDFEENRIDGRFTFTDPRND